MRFWNSFCLLWQLCSRCTNKFATLMNFQAIQAKETRLTVEPMIDNLMQGITPAIHADIQISTLTTYLLLVGDPETHPRSMLSNDQIWGRCNVKEIEGESICSFNLVKSEAFTCFLGCNKAIFGGACHSTISEV